MPPRLVGMGNNQMKALLLGLAAWAVVQSVPALAAEDEAPAYENGPVWDMAHIQTKDGHFDDYMKWVSSDWKAQEEALKKAGVIIGYKVYLVSNPRQGEPDVILAQEWPNMAAFDRSVADRYKIDKSIYGSVVKSNQQEADRGSIRTVQGDVLMREAILK
jgi:hypothetical protein